MGKNKNKKAKEKKEKKVASKGAARPRAAAPKGGSLYAVEPGGNLQLLAEKSGLSNAAMFVKSLLSPFASDAQRLPDAFSATVVGKFIDRKKMTLVADSVNTDNYAGLFINPVVSSHYFEITASAGGTLTWGNAANHPQYATYLANYLYIRCTGLSIRIHDYGSMLNRGARIYIGLQPYAVTPTTIDQFGQNPRTLVVSSTEASITGEPIEIPWLPFSWSPNQVTNSGTSPVAYAGGLGWRIISDGDFEDQRLVVIAVQPDGASDSFQVDISSHWEFIPIWTNWSLFNPVMAVGTTADVARIVQECMLLNKSGDEPGRFAWAVSARKDIETVIANTTGGGSFFGKIGKFAKGAISTVGNMARGAYNVAQTVVRAGGALAAAGLTSHQARLAFDPSVATEVHAAHLQAVLSGDVQQSPWFNADVAQALCERIYCVAKVEEVEEKEDIKSYDSTPGQIPPSLAKSSALYKASSPRRL